MAFDARSAHYTTIGNWKQQGHDVVWDGETYQWSKHHEFLKYLDLPQRVRRASFELCLNIDDAEDRARLLAHGWKLSSPLTMSLDPWGYQRFFRESRAEWTVAKDQNVRLQSGWFSERDACYLASGKPVIAQSTGFEHYLPTGAGLFAFRNLDEVRAAVEVIEGTTRRPVALRATWRRIARGGPGVPPLPGRHRAMSQGKYVIFNADDFGYGRGINRASSKLTSAAWSRRRR